METNINNKCKAFTSLEQSRKLAEILPLESADMHFVNNKHAGCVPYLEMTKGSNPWLKGTDISACWSLAALLEILPKIINNETLFIETSAALWHIGYRNIFTARVDNPVDACYELILMLNELKML